MKKIEGNRPGKELASHEQENGDHGTVSYNYICRASMFLSLSPLPTILQTGVSDIQSQHEMCSNAIISGPKYLTQGQKTLY